MFLHVCLNIIYRINEYHSMKGGWGQNVHERHQKLQFMAITLKRIVSSPVLNNDATLFCLLGYSMRHYKIFCVNGKCRIRSEFRIFYFMSL